MIEKVVVINKKRIDKKTIDKNSAHKIGGIAHKAISVFLFDKEKLLIQKRSRYKKLWPLYWSNSCCSHPKIGETNIAAGKRCVREELGIEAVLKPLFKIRYYFKFKNIGSENEVTKVLSGRVEAKSVIANKKEVAAIRFISLNKLFSLIRQSPEKFTPWFKLMLKNKNLLAHWKKNA